MKGNKMDPMSLLRFDEMITPKIIIVLYWLGLLGVLLSGISSMFFFGFSFASFLKGLLIILLGVLLVRVYCELLILLFKMNEALQEIRKK
jgi:hypothetical protein